MKIFLSHSSRDKALVREIRSHLPAHIKTWLDTDDLLVGADLKVSIQNAINEEVDFVVIFLGHEAVESDWVKRELEWAMAREKDLGHVFVLPVVLEDVWDRVEPASFQQRHYLKCFDQSEETVQFVAGQLANQIFAWVSRRLDEVTKDSRKSDKVKEIPGKVAVEFLAGTRAQHWVQASRFNAERTRKVTSLYIPLRLENLDRTKSVTLNNVEVIETKSSVKLMPPRQVQIKVPGGQPLVYTACNLALPEIFNTGQTIIAAASAEETAIMLQEADVHRDEYNLRVDFTDDYERSYSFDRYIRVKDYSNWQTGQDDEWTT